MKQLEGRIQPYPWGSTTLLPEFLGVPSSGEPQAELWLGAHPQAPARIDATTLDAEIEADPRRWVGDGPVLRFGPRLPFLMKVLAAGAPLSLQAHPDRQRAEAGFARENAAGIARDAAGRTYRDDWPKPEALCALDTFDALCGFREPAQTYQLFDQLGVPAARDLVQPLRSGGAPELEQVFCRLLRLPDAGDLVAAVIDAAHRRRHEPGSIGDFCRTATEIGAYYPGDLGVLAALIMNRVRLERNDAIYLPPGNLHAYLSGIGVEIMANSDNVLRGGLTGKHIDVDELAQVLDFTPGFAGTVPVCPETPGVFAYQTGAGEFALRRLDVDHTLQVPATGQGRIALVTSGSVTLRATSAPGANRTHDADAVPVSPDRSEAHASHLDLAQGESGFLLPEDQVQADGNGTVFVGSAGSW